MRKLSIYLLFIQTFLLAAIFIWVVTQKVEADKQKVYAKESIYMSQLEANKRVYELENIKNMAIQEMNNAKKRSEANKTEADKYKELYEQSLKQKK